MKPKLTLRSLLSNSKAMRTGMQVLGTALFLVAMVNFLIFCIVTTWIGGDALQGKVEGGRYYVVSRQKFTEVSPGVWYFSRAHTMSVLITHPLGILGGGGLVALSRRLQKRA